MALPRSKYVREGQEGVYHCFSRCVRRAFLYGFDTLTLRDFSHRKAWILERMRVLAALFAIEVCAYSIMENHYHIILRTRPDLVALWSDREVATRWLTLFPRHRRSSSLDASPLEEDINALVQCPERISTLRRRLSSLSWFMRCLNESIARTANKEDHVKGRFWEARFKCQALLDEAAIAACMAYVDLNPIRAGRASTPEESDFTSIQERILAWHKESTAGNEAVQHLCLDSSGSELQDAEGRNLVSNANPERDGKMNNAGDDKVFSEPWLCPIGSDARRRGILKMTTVEYFELVDRSGRLLKSDKRGTIDPDLAPILLRIRANPEAWLDTVSGFGSKFRLAAGLLPSLRKFADQLGRRWLTGVAAARMAFMLSPPELA